MAITPIEGSGSCMWMTLTGFAYESGTPKDWLKSVLNQHMRGWGGSAQKLYSVYVFGGPKVAVKPKTPATGYNSDYAYSFYRFLRKEGLGKVVMSPLVENEKFHKGRKGRVYMWAPDQAACKAWFEANCKPNTP